MNVSSTCSQCKAIANPTDRFCNTCGSPLHRPAPPPAAAPAYGAPPPVHAAQPPAQGPGQAPGGAYGSPPARCQLGHEIAPGASYCPQGHPIALDAMQFAHEPSAYAPAAAAQGYAPPQPVPAYAPAQQYVPQAAPQAYPPVQPVAGAYAPPPGYAPQPAPPGYAPPPPAPQAYSPPQPVFQPAPVPPPAAPAYAPPAAPPEPAAPNVKTLRGFLVSFQANPGGEFWALGTGRTTVGRSNAAEPAEIPLADATISSRHAVFLIDMASVVVEDTSSTNGTYVNEEHIGQNGRRELRDGDRVRFGGFTTLVKILGRP